MRRRKFSGFTLVELLISIILLAIVGYICVSTLHIMLRFFLRVEDRAVSEMETDWAFSVIDKTMANTGLGLPPVSLDVAFREHKNKRGYFYKENTYTTCISGDGRPVMADMTYGPVMIFDENNTKVDTLSNGCYEGPVLYYTWSEPTGEFLDPNKYDNNGNNPTSLADYADWPNKYAKPRNTTKNPSDYSKFINWPTLSQDYGIWCSITSVWLKTTSGKDLRDIQIEGSTVKERGGCWIAFPSFGVPCWLVGYFINDSGVREERSWVYVGLGAVDPSKPNTDPNQVLMGGILVGYEEVHIVRGGKLARAEDGTLTQELYRYHRNEDYSESLKPIVVHTTAESLVRNVAGVWFQFYPDTRILKMFIAVRGREQRSFTDRPIGWPEKAPAFENESRNILVRTKTWQLQN